MYPLRGNWKHKRTIFNEFDFITIVSDHLPLPLGYKDKYSYTKTLETISISKERIFVSFPDLDGIAHKFGMDSSQYKERIEWIDSHCEKLVDKFLNRHPQGKIVVLSDHGMAKAKESVNLQLERKFGRPDPNRLVYFYDSLYLRIWVQDCSLEKEIINFLQESEIGYVLTEERSFWGLSDPKFGKIIFLLKEGYAFVPNYFGLRLHKAYHGYHPKLESQKCIFLCNGSKIEDEPKYLIEVYNVLRGLIKGSNYG
jgi:predicted AlkP superfamily pyrophosphatase or phosphodiesterase